MLTQTQNRLDNMTTARLRNLILGICVVDSTKHLKQIIPAANEFDLRKKKDCLLFYGVITRTTVLV